MAHAEKTLFLRKGNIIRTIENNSDEKFYSINKAKKRSRKFQIENDGSIGRRCLMVVEKLT